MASTREGSGLAPKVWQRSFWKGVWSCMDACDCVRLRTAPSHWNVPQQYGPHGELFFFLLKENPMVVNDMVYGPMIGLHIMTEEVAMRLDSDSSPYLGDQWRYGCPRSPVWSNGCLDET